MRWIGRKKNERSKRERAHWEKVSRELWSSLFRRDTDHRLRGCCRIKGFVSQSPLTLSPQSRLQVLREAWTWNNSWPEKLTLKCSLPRMRQRIWGHRSQSLPLSAPRHGVENSCWVWLLFLYCIICFNTQAQVVCLAQTQSCCEVFVCGINGMFFLCIWVGRWVDAWHEICCFSLPFPSFHACVWDIFSFSTVALVNQIVRSHSTQRSKFQTTYGLGLLEAYMNTIKSSSGSSVTQGWLETLRQSVRIYVNWIYICCCLK